MTGKGLAFLNKKGWHVSTMANQERVWKREQEVLAEQKKIAQLKREKQEEAKIEELRQLNEVASGVKRAKRVDFLYEQPMQKTSAEDYLLGKKIDDSLIADGGAAATSSESKKDAGAANVPGSLWLGDKLDPTVDTASKIRDDPMFVMKQRERDALKKILENPMQMKMLRQQVHGADKADHKSSSKKHKKKHRKHRHHKKKRRHSPSSSESSSSSRSSSSSSSSKSAPQQQQQRAPGGGIVFGGKSSSASSAAAEQKRSDNQAVAAVNANYQHYKNLADERSKQDNFKRAPRREVTQEEREERIRAMQRDAAEHEEDRHKRARKSREEDERERAELMGRAANEATSLMGGPSFVSDMKRDVLGVGEKKKQQR